MRTIYKYKIDIADWQMIFMPKDYKILYLGVQNGSAYIWALVDTENKDVGVEVVVYGTEHPIRQEDLDICTYLGSVIIDPFVWHVFYR